MGTEDAEKDLIYSSGDIISADLITEEVSFKGNVKILFENYELSAKNAKVNKKTTTLVAWGDVILEGNNSYIEADKVTLNYKTKEGDLEGVRLTSGKLLIEAKRIKKLSDDIYEAEKARYTTCSTCPGAWRIKGRKIKTNIKEYIQIKGGRFQILNRSLFPLPNLTFPLTNRKTGFIQPELEKLPGEVGLEFSQPFFWNIDKHRDLTLTPMWYFDFNDFQKLKGFESNGAKLHAEYNQWLGSKSRLKLNTALMYDGTFVDENGQLAPDTRWFIDYTNFFVLPRNVIQKTNFTLLKERNYLNTFISEVSGRGEAALKNTFSLSQEKGNRFASAEVVYHINLLVENPNETENLSIQKLPELSYDISTIPFFKNRLLFKSNATYTNFHRNARSYDEVTDSPDQSSQQRQANPVDFDIDPEGDGVFDVAGRDLIRTGHRLRLQAEVSSPFKIGKLFDVMPALNYRDSYYSFNLDKDNTINNNSDTPYSPFAFSRYLEFSNSLRTEFSKVISPNFKHKIIPDLSFRLGTQVDRSDNVFFESQGNLPFHRQYQPISDNDFFNFRHGVQFDYWDRFFRAETLELNITNILIRKNKQELVTYYDQPFFFNLRQSYDFRNERTSDTPDPWSNLDGVLKLRSKRFVNFTKFSYFYKARKINISTESQFIYKPGRFISLGYSDFSTVDEAGVLETNNRVKNLSSRLGWEFPTLKFSGNYNYSILDKKSLGWEADFLYTPRGNCWGLGVRVTHIVNLNANRVDENGQVTQVDSSDTGVRLRFQFDFGPDPQNRSALSANPNI